jgi:hypothetical protein
MTTQAKNLQSEKLNGTEEENQSKQNYIFEQINNTPFTIYGNEDEGYYILCGKHRLNERKLSKEEALNDCNNISWEKITQLIMIILKNDKEQEIKK